MPYRRLAIACAVALSFLFVPSVASAKLLGLPDVLAPVAHNPAEQLLDTPIDPFAYDVATHCVKQPTKGALALQSWLQSHVRGESWGIMRCELWGKGSASLHAEGRAVDWHLDSRVPADKKAAIGLIALLFAPDSDGNPAALARRMGIQEIIYDCQSWFGGPPAMTNYSACYTPSGRRKQHVDPTTGHLNHIHLGLTKTGARMRTSFWESL